LAIINYTTDSIPLFYNGRYNVEVTYPGGCRMVSADYIKAGLSQNILRVAVFVTDSTIMLPGAKLANFTVYPNPNDGTFTIDYSSASSSNLTIKLYNATGAIVANWSFENTSGKLYETVTTENLAAGMYILTLSDGFNSYTNKLVIK